MPISTRSSTTRRSWTEATNSQTPKEPDDGDEDDTAQKEPDDEEEDNNTPVRTGDENYLTLWFMILSLSAAALFILIEERRSSRR